MAKKIKDTDYLTISARIRAMENGLLTKERMDQILDAKTDEEAVKILQEQGYQDIDIKRPESIDNAISAIRDEILDDLTTSVPDPRYIDVFKLKYDYHNIKALMKAEFMGANPDRMLLDMGRIGVKELKAAFAERNFENFPGCLADAAKEALEVLDTTRDPQLSDIVLDRWYYHDMELVAKATGSKFLLGYVKVQIDSVNLRSLVRTIRMGKNADFLKNVLIDGGETDTALILKISANNGDGLAELYAFTLFREAAAIGAEKLKGGALTEFEKSCDDAVNAYLADASFVPFGEAPLLAYLASRETEYTNIRILLLGRSAGLDADIIRSRLRISNV